MAKVDKVVKGEKFTLKVYFILGTMKAKVVWSLEQSECIGEISEDFRYISTPDTFKTPYIDGVGRVPFGKISLNKYLQSDAKDYNQIKK